MKSVSDLHRLSYLLASGVSEFNARHLSILFHELAKDFIVEEHAFNDPLRKGTQLATAVNVNNIISTKRLQPRISTSESKFLDPGTPAPYRVLFVLK